MVKRQVAKGGGAPFKYIATEKKVFLNVSLADMQGPDRNPVAFREKQSNDWNRYWGPHPFGNRHAATALKLNQFRHHAFEHV